MEWLNNSRLLFPFVFVPALVLSVIMVTLWGCGTDDEEDTYESASEWYIKLEVIEGEPSITFRQELGSPSVAFLIYRDFGPVGMHKVETENYSYYYSFIYYNVALQVTDYSLYIGFPKSRNAYNLRVYDIVRNLAGNTAAYKVKLRVSWEDKGFAHVLPDPTYP